MDSWPENQKRKPIVTVEFQTEVDVATGSSSRRMFVKMYFEARDSGLLAALPAELWKTLCCLATYIDENGYCFPSQARLARDLGLARETVNRRIQSLLKFRFQGQPVLTMKKERKTTTVGGRWANNIYQFRPVAGFAIFDERNRKEQKPSSTDEPYVTEKSHRPVSVDHHIADDHTNQTQELTRRLNVNDLEKSALEKGKQHQGVSDSEFDATVQRRILVADILAVCGDEHSRGFYTRVAQKLPAEVIRAALSETKYQAQTGKIKKSKGAFFTDEITRIAKTRGIDFRSNLAGGYTGRSYSPKKLQ